MEFVQFRSTGFTRKYTFGWGVLDAWGHKHYTDWDVDAWQPTHGYQLWFPDPATDALEATLVRMAKDSEDWEVCATLPLDSIGKVVRQALEIIAGNEKPGMIWEHDKDGATLWLKEE